MPRSRRFVPERPELAYPPEKSHRFEGTKHKQIPVFINGGFTTVDEDLVNVILDLNSMGMTTRFSCQGQLELLNSGTEEEDWRGMIMFEGLSSWRLLMRYLPDLTLSEEQEQIFLNMHMAEHLRDHWGEGGPYETLRREIIIPAGEGSQWTVEFDAPRSRKGRRFGLPPDNFHRHTVRFPPWDIQEFTKMIHKLAKKNINFA